MPPPTRDKPADYHYHTYDFARSAPFTPGPEQPDRGRYQFYSLVKDLDGLVATGRQNKVPNIRVDSAGIPTWGGRRTLVLEFGNPGRRRNVPTVVLTGGIHAKEWVAAEIVYLVAEYLIMHYPAGEPANRYQRAIRDLVNSRNIRIIPMLNPDGNDYSVFSADDEARLWRRNRRSLPKSATGWVITLTIPGGARGAPNPPFTNVRLDETRGPARALYDVPDYNADGVPPRRPISYHRGRELAKGQTGVDLNRNNDTPAFGYGAPPKFEDWDPATETYWGPKKSGEAETANVRTYLTPIGSVAAAIDYHSFGEDIMYPTEALNNGAVGADHKCLGRLLRQLIRDEDDVHYRLGAAELIGYDTTGAADDYMALRHQARAFTIELDPDDDDPDGFELKQERIMTCFEKNICGALGLLAAPARTGNLARELASMNAALLQYGNWHVFGRGNQLPDRG